jgi:MraZ protein
MTAFRGAYEHPVDEKGRVSVPHKFREILRARGDERLVLTRFVIGKSRCLHAFPIDAWLELETRLAARPQFDPKFTVFKQFYLGSAHECQIDKQGRILIPPRLREYAGLNGDVVFVGDLDKFIIWDRQIHAPVDGAGEELLMQEPSFLSDL